MSATTVQRSVHQTRFHAMGTEAEVQVVDGDPRLADRARTRIEWLEARWSRFRSGSDVTSLNRCAGAWVPVAPETLTLLEHAVGAAAATDGRYDPTVGNAVVAHGYDRTFTQVAEHAGLVQPHPVVDGSWPMIEIDRAGGRACVPEGTTFDPGGIGKGLAADLVVGELGAEADGLLVNLGGDLRMVGTAPDPVGWVISVEDPFGRIDELGRLAVPHGGVATSSSEKRRWQTAAGPAHHLIDPRTGRPADTGVAAVTVVAAEAWWAEVQATSLFLAGPDGLDQLDGSVEAALILADGTTAATPAFEEVLS